MTEFNLIDEPWIDVLTGDCEVISVGLRELFSEAHELRSLYGDSPAQDAAVLRLLLAIMYAAYLRGSDLQTDDDAYDLWERIHSQGRFGPEVGDYLESRRDGFWLFHDQRPFYQVNITSGTECFAAKLDGNMSETTSKPRLFRMKSGDEKESMSYPEAARWLVYLNAYDDTSMKPTVRGGSMPSAGTGWPGKLGLIYAEGDNLFETLMLNLPLADHMRIPFPDGTAPWEREPDTRERVRIETPKDPLGMLTLQSRRILLEREAGRVTGYRIAGGDIVDTAGAITEQMTVWRKGKQDKLVPKRHDPGRAMWRDFSGLVLETAADSKKVQRPGIIDWMTGLADRGIPLPERIRIRATGVAYSDKNFFVTDLVDDSVMFSSNLLATSNRVWRIIISNLVERTDRCVTEAVRLSARLSDYSGSDESVRKRRTSAVRGSLFTRLDVPFRIWLASVDPERCDPEGMSAGWVKTLESIVLEFGDGLVENAGGKAVRGIGDTADPFGHNAFIAFQQFRANVFAVTRGTR